MNKEKKVKLTLFVIAVLICGGIYFCNNYVTNKDEVVTESFADSSSQPITENNEKQKNVSSQTVYIHICGEVKKPGVYTFEQEPRVIEAIRKAGGFTKKADRQALNQAEIVTDGIQLVVPAKSREKDKDSSKQQSDTVSADKVNINKASKEDLMTLSGIGESKAVQIISYRESNGAFKKIEDIMNISGIKNGVFDKIKDCIVV